MVSITSIFETTIKLEIQPELRKEEIKNGTAVFKSLFFWQLMCSALALLQLGIKSLKASEIKGILEVQGLLAAGNYANNNRGLNN